jgi:hypothetical protein
MKGGKGVDLQKELEKMCNASMDSYNSNDDSNCDTDSDSEESNTHSKTVQQGGKSRFAQ